MLNMVKFTAQTDWPADRRRSKEEKDLEGIDWEQSLLLDLVPRKGDMVDIGGDYLEVSEVYINPGADGTSTIEVHFENVGLVLPQSHAGMIAAGWKEM